MTILNQIGELREHIAHFGAEKERLSQEIQLIKDRLSTGRIYGDESTQLKSKRSQLARFDELIKEKEKAIARLNQSLQVKMFS